MIAEQHANMPDEEDAEDLYDTTSADTQDLYDDVSSPPPRQTPKGIPKAGAFAVLPMANMPKRPPSDDEQDEPLYEVCIML